MTEPRIEVRVHVSLVHHERRSELRLQTSVGQSVRQESSCRYTLQTNCLSPSPSVFLLHMSCNSAIFTLVTCIELL